MALPIILAQGAIRVAPWVIGYFITDKIADTVSPDKNGVNKNNFKQTDLERVLDGTLSVPSLANNFNPIPSASNNGFGVDFEVKDIIKLAMLGGAVFVGFKALNEGKKLL